MQAGQILQVGTATEVYTNPAHPFVATFLGDANLIPCVASPTPEGLELHPQGGRVFFSRLREATSCQGAGPTATRIST